MDLDSLKLMIECDFELHKDFVQNNIRNFGSDDPDVILISEDGREVTTNKIFLSLFTPMFNNLCSEPRHQTANINVPFPYETLTLLLQFLTTGYVSSQEEDQLNRLMELMNCLNINTEDMKINQIFPRGKPTIQAKKKESKKKSKGMVMVSIKEEASDDISEDHLGEEENSMECKICKKRFKNRSGLEQHRVTHTKEKSYECTECGKKFGTPGILYNHGFVHNPPHHCQICASKFAQKAGLQNHMKKSHGSS